MAIQYVGGVSGGRNGNSNSTTTQSLTALTGGIASAPAEGDVVFVVCVSGSQGRNPSAAISGYSTIGTQLNVTSTTYDTSLQVSYKVQTSTPDTSITIPAQGNAADAQSWGVMVFRGLDAAIFDATSVSATGTASTNFNAAAITPATAGAWIVIAGGGAAALTGNYTAPTDFATDWVTNNGSDTNDASAGIGYYEGWTSGSYDPAAVTGGSVNAANSWAAWTIALKPKIVSGSGAGTLPLLTASGSGTVSSVATHSGSGAGTLPLPTASGAGKKTRSGTGAATLPLATAGGIGLNLPLNPVARRSLRYRWIETGGVYRKQWHPVADPVLYQVTAQAAVHSGSGTPTLPLATASGAGKRALKSTGAATLPLVTASGAGSSAEDVYSGSGAATLPLLTASGAGTKARKGSGSSALPILTASGTAKRELKGSGAVVLPFVTASGAGTKARKGTGAATLPVLIASGAGKRALKGAGTPALPLLTASGDGQLEGTHTGSGVGSLPTLTAEGTGNVVSIATEQPSGGYAAQNYAALERQRRRRLKALEDEDEADRLEALLIAEGKLPPNPVIDDRITVREYAVQAEAFNRRTQRAIDYALRARTDLAYQLAAREIANQLEDEEFAVMLLLAVAA